ncbi:MAG: 30S ribosomal protein S7 [Candidatus Omnitrophica bacterium]|nr:30S ribosomal protein S7 [Candidatus Omnitrophota bacterium]
MRRHSAEKRKITGDPKYNSDLITRFVAIIMTEGKKTIAERIVYSALDILKEKTNEDSPVKALNKAVDNVRPRLEVKSRRVGGATYQVPTDVVPARGVSLAMRWIRDYARNKKGKPMEIKLAEELVSAYKNEGPAIKKRDETHKMAEANRAFSHLRW